MTISIRLAENGALPDFLISHGIKRLLRKRLLEIKKNPQIIEEEIISDLKKSPIAISTEEANKQHYEVPVEFFKFVLGKNLKYSSSCFERGATSLDSAEEEMLKIYIERAQITDGMNILDLGCDWGSEIATEPGW